MGVSELAMVGIAGSGLGSALGVPMVWRRSPARPGVRLLGGGLLAVSGLGAVVSARLLGWLAATVAVEHAVNLLGLTAYALVYLYVRQQARPEAPLRSSIWVWLPAVSYGAVLGVRWALGTGTRVPFAWMLPLVLSFTIACAAELPVRRNTRSNDVLRAEWIVAFLVVLNIAQVTRLAFGGVAPVRALVPLVATLGFAAIVGLLAWRSAGSARGAVPQYEKSGLDQEAAAVLLAHIERALGVDRLFSDPGLTLSRLAAAVDSTPQLVSEVLNRHQKVTFHELLNRHRVDDVKAGLLDPSSDHYTVEGIGASAGFRSRSALYAAFRRLEGITPTEFRKRRS